MAAGASFNYLGGAMSSVTGGITVAGMLELDGPGKSALGVLHASLSRDGSGWKWGAMLHAGPVYSSVDFQPLYPQVSPSLPPPPPSVFLAVCVCVCVCVCVLQL